MRPPGADTVLVRYGEMGTKSWRVRRPMERQLCDNLRALLDDRGVAGEVEQLPARPLIRTPAESVDDATATAADAFGVVSASPALSVAPEFDAVVDALATIAPDVYRDGTFAVTARRADKELPFTSHDVEREGGTAIWEAVEVEFEPAVDLDDPDVTFSVEVREGEAFVFLEKRAGPGGLPLGTQSRLVGLVSGGIDSPVAIYEMMRRGCPVRPIYLDLGDFGGADHRARAIETMRDLARYAPNADLSVLVVPAGDTLAALAEQVERGRMLSFRRYMYRVAEHVADREDACGIVTGEALGQKSSQTAQNLAVTSAAATLPVHRPLVAMDKTEITDRARAIGTFAGSTIPAGCNRFAPDQVDTHGRLDRLLDAEPDDLLDRAAEDAAKAEHVPV